MKFRFVAAALAAMVLSSAHAEAQRAVPETREQIQLSYAPLVRTAAPAVVNIYASRMVAQQASPFLDDPFFQRFFGGENPFGQAQPRQQNSLGSGVIVRGDGTIITNAHVIQGAEQITVVLADRREFKARVVLEDDRVDLAVLKIDTGAERMPFLALSDSDDLAVGDLVLAIGNPFGVGQTVTSGIVSALARNQVRSGDFGFFIQTDASINPGNSGGGLINMNGELIGINTAIFSRGGGSNGVGFAIPANLVKTFIASAENGSSTFDRPFIGATFDPVTSEVAEALGLDRARGALVSQVQAGSPAEKAGMKPGQVVTAVNGVPVEHPDALGYRLTTVGIGGTARITVVANGKEEELTLSLDRAPETTPRDERLIEGRNPFSGAIVANLSPRVAEDLRMPTNRTTTGVVVTEVNRGSPAARIGLQPRDIIIALNGTEVASTEILASLVTEDPSIWRVEIERDGQRIRQFFR